VTDVLLDFDETSHVAGGDFRVHYHEAGSGPTLILLHGSGPGVSGWSNFKGNLPVFAKQFRTIVMDMPGFGLTPAVEWTRPYPKVAFEAVRELMDELEIDKASVLGNSMGGAVAFELALAYPERVDRMVLMGPGGIAAMLFAPQPSEGGKRLTEFLNHPTRENMVAWVDCMVANKAVVSEELIDERLTNALKPGVVETTAGIFATFADPRFKDDVPSWAFASRVETPTLITWGRDDRMVPFDMGLFGFRQMPNAELHAFSKCGHWAQVERKSDFERLVVDFLTR
jgi:4,5:9,10-diseco-3-hydroxy-5,9,17-trioxoandrosta-1(10),2-diene-4-oate hydrolase